MDKSFEYRGKKTLTILFIMRLAPAALVLIATVAVGTAYPVALSRMPDANITVAAETIWAAGLLLTLAIAAVGLLFTWLDYIGFRYVMDDHAFRIKTGIFNLREFSIPYRQIMNVDLERPLLYRILGVSKILIVTSGREDVHVPEHESEAVLDLMDKNVSTEIQRELLHRTQVQMVAETENNPHE